jgi:hypothetical protein
VLGGDATITSYQENVDDLRNETEDLQAQVCDICLLPLLACRVTTSCETFADAMFGARDPGFFLGKNSPDHGNAGTRNL